MIATLFDFDGVLVDSEPIHLAAFNDVLGSSGLAIDPRHYVEHYLSLDDAGVFRDVLSAAGHTPDEQQVHALVAAKSPHFLARFAASVRVFPGAVEVVLHRATRGPVGIVSGSLRREIVFALDKIGVAAAVSFVVSAESTTASKPDAAPYRFALDELRRRGHAGGAVVVEDSLGGVVSARAAGLRCVAVTHSYSAEELTRAGANDVVPDLTALTDALLERDA